MGNKHVGKAPLFAGFHQQIQNLGLDGNIQGGNRLVRHNKLRIHHEGPGNADPLTLSARKFMGIAYRPLGVDSHLLHHLGNPVCGFTPGNVLIMKNNRFFQSLFDGFPGIQRRVGILKNHLHLRTVGQHFLR